MRWNGLLGVFWLLLPALSLAAQPSGAKAKQRLDAKHVAAFALLDNIQNVTVNVSGGFEIVHQYGLAGAHQFHALWVRDFCNSVPAYILLGQQNAVRDSLDAIFAAQRQIDGVIPRGLDHYSPSQRITSEYLGITLDFIEPLFPNFDTENNVISIDGNLLVPIAAWQYLQAYSDPERLKAWWPKAVSSIDWIWQAHLTQDLVDRQPPFGDWEDSLRRTGRVALTNEQYQLALRSMADWAKRLGDSAAAANYEAKLVAAKAAFNQFFFDAKKGYVRSFESDDHLSADANYTAVAENLLPADRAAQVMTTVKGSALWGVVPGRATFPDYPDSMKSSFVGWAGIKDYHDSLSWIWLGAEAAMAERAIGNADSCNDILDRLSALIMSQNQVYEVYSPGSGSPEFGTLTPVKRLFYKSEGPFTWNAARFYEAASLGCQKPAP
jgi:GH15 family glucan-1,4-alpha-glucosidase